VADLIALHMVQTIEEFKKEKDEEGQIKINNEFDNIDNLAVFTFLSKANCFSAKVIIFLKEFESSY